MNAFFKNFIVFFCISVFFLVPIFSCLPAGRVFAADNPQSNLEKIFYISNAKAEDGVKSLNANWQKIDIVAPQMFAVEPNFLVAGGLGPKLKKAISNHNLKVMPLIVNAKFSRTTIHNLLTSPSGQDKVINALIVKAKSQKYIGWQFDFENIDYKDRDLFTAFVQKAYPVFQKNSLIFSVAMIARSVDYENTDAFKNWAGVYDYQKIADSSDFVTLMAYDDPKSLGPVASIDFVNKALAYAKDKIPADKLSLGVPLYYWKWNADTNKKIGSGLFQNILSIVSNFKYVLNFDKSLGVSCLTYSYGKTNYKVWFEDKQSFQAKLNIIKDNNLRGFSAWLLGGEDQNIWKIL